MSGIGGTVWDVPFRSRECLESTVQRPSPPLPPVAQTQAACLHLQRLEGLVGREASMEVECHAS